MGLAVVDKAEGTLTTYVIGIDVALETISSQCSKEFKTSRSLMYLVGIGNLIDLKESNFSG